MSMCQITFRIVAEQGLRFQSFSGFAVRGVFFDFLKSVNEELALRLHSQKSLAPYSVTPVEALRGCYSSFVYNSFNGPLQAQFKISILEQGLMKVFTQALFSTGSPNIRLVDTYTTIVEVSVNQQSFEKIMEEAKPVRRFEVFFRTPCYFRQSLSRDSSDPVLKVVKPPYRAVPLPEVHLMIRNLVRLWRRFSGISFEYNEYVDWIKRNGIALAGFPYGIKTLRVYEHPTSNKWVMGFIGRVRFAIPKDMFLERFSKFTDALMKFAEYSNVGGNRTAGFGVVKYSPKYE
ncbi:MAG: CRISPR system precrRNA processing endoribonuclease RAMP protein Cas6 [Crenarchaeota archaeon]|nr:CRISPR system precrRNA processing endoribonuclease RAMP protein Cas6 [Thermoproteota archaeon]MDW8034117.1 CRISPR system precrRNA processing endoribonuclease RAMP protein Cas6 [Nitrososphaerota archaeon]